MAVDILAYIKRLLLQGRVVFTLKAQREMYFDALSDDEVIEAIINAPAINKNTSFHQPSARPPEGTTIRYSWNNV